MSDIKAGMRFKNAGMDCEVIKFTETPKTNVALLFCHSDGLHITVRNLQLWNGRYVWDWGHYFSSEPDALDDYETRKKEL